MRSRGRGMGVAHVAPAAPVPRRAALVLCRSLPPVRRLHRRCRRPGAQDRRRPVGRRAALAARARPGSRTGERGPGQRLMAPTLAWWKLLSLAGAINIALWIGAWQHVDAERRVLFWLAGIYVLGCAFRSFLPMIDVPRLCLARTPVSRIFIGRSVATVAELAFAAQWALLLDEAGARRAAVAVFGLILAAEALSWIAVLARNDLFHAAENALWTITAAIAVGFLATRSVPQSLMLAAWAGAAAYVGFMLVYVVPMYMERWRDGSKSLALAEGLRSTLAPCTIDRDWELWWRDALWLTPYFTICVWLSLALAFLPRL